MTDTFLLNDFYKISAFEATENAITATLALNAEHPVFKGHFEKMPVVPGVFQTQIIKEILQQHLSQKLQLSHGDNIKFMAMIVPGHCSQILLDMSFKQDENKYSVAAKLFSENITFTKFTATFITL